MGLETNTRDALREKLKKSAARAPAPDPVTALQPGTPLWDLYVASDDRNLPGIKKSFAKHPELMTANNLTIILLNGVQGARNDIIDYALAQKADVNRADAAGMTPLQMAIRQGEADIFLKLLKAGGDPNAKNKDGKSLRQLAAWSDLAECDRISKMLADKKLMASLGHGPKTAKRAPR